MHNTHLILISNDDIDYATSEVNSIIDNYGSEDNWGSIERILDMNNLDVTDRAYLQSILEELNRSVAPKKVDEIKDNIKILQRKANDKDRFIYWQIGELYKELYECTGTEPNYTIQNIIDGEVSNYNGFTYDMFGFTDLSDSDIDNLYLAVIDMHS